MRAIRNFPYPTKYCTYCERELTPELVMHMPEAPENYKVLFFCKNPKCGAYDEDARKCYALVFYSSSLAFQHLEAYRLWVPERKTV